MLHVEWVWVFLRNKSVRGEGVMYTCFTLTGEGVMYTCFTLTGGGGYVQVEG